MTRTTFPHLLLPLPLSLTSRLVCVCVSVCVCVGERLLVVFDMNHTMVSDVL